MEKSVESRVIECIASYAGESVDTVKPESNLVDDLDMDSLDMVEIVMELEDEFELEIPDAEAERFRTVGDAVEYLSQRVGEAA